MKKEQKQIRIKCPVCKEVYWSHTMKGHITNMGSREVYYLVNDLVKYSPNKKITPEIFLQCRHYAYRMQHLKNKLIFTL